MPPIIPVTSRPFPRRGYRFIAEVAAVNPPSKKLQAVREVVETGPIEPSAFPAKANIARARYIPGRAWKIVGVALVLLAVIFVVCVFLWKRQPPVNAFISIHSFVSSASTRKPFRDSEDYFADGMTDELITDLAQISALRVISRTSVMPYKGVRKPLPQMARELSVDAVVEGTVLHSGKQVRITAQLIRAPWTSIYGRRAMRARSATPLRSKKKWLVPSLSRSGFK